MNFKNTIIIMTSNLGSAEILQAHGEMSETLKAELLAKLRQYFRPEFLNRIDETLIFHPLSKAEIRQIVTLQLLKLSGRLQAQDIALEVSDAAKDLLADAGYDPDFGARPLKRAVIRLLETPLSRKLLAGEILPGSTLHIDVQNGTLSFN